MPRRTVFSEEEETEINLSPMIDCIFILLIFFIVTTVFVEERGFSVAKPDAARRQVWAGLARRATSDTRGLPAT